jgi:glycosyltransferase involved in cell wall biosynthesis
MEASVIFTTYNSPLWLQKVLWGYQSQSFKDFEVIIADDGSTVETANLVNHFALKNFYPIKHIWQEDNGFRKCEILNKAILASSADYLIFSDGDCIPQRDFLKTHIDKREGGYFLSGGYFKLPMNISKLINEDDILSGRCFNLSWLKKNGLPSSWKNTKLFNNKTFASLMNHITPTHASWNGHNASAWKKDIVAVNGYDERMKYGGEDRELGERLMNSGIKEKQVRYSAICLHLDHERSYINQEDLNRNASIRAVTKKEKKKWTDTGITLHQHSDSE